MFIFISTYALFLFITFYHHVTIPLTNDLTRFLDSAFFQRANRRVRPGDSQVRVGHPWPYRCYKLHNYT